MASENCKPTAKCLGIATLVIVGLLFFYNVALKGTSPDFALKVEDDGQLKVTVTNIDKFPAYDREAEEGAGFKIELKARKMVSKTYTPDPIYEEINIAPKDQQKKSVVFGHMEDYLGGSVTVTYMRGKEGFGSSTMEVPSKSNSNNNEKYIQIQDVSLDKVQGDSYKMSLIRNDGKPQPTKAKKEDDQ
eukprot:238407_1